MEACVPVWSEPKQENWDPRLILLTKWITKFVLTHLSLDIISLYKLLKAWKYKYFPNGNFNNQEYDAHLLLAVVSFSSSFSPSSAESAVPIPHLSRPEVVQTNCPAARALGAAQRKPFCSLLPPPLPRSLFTQRWHTVCRICLSVSVYLCHETMANPSSIPLPPTLLYCPLKASSLIMCAVPQIWPLHYVA